MNPYPRWMIGSDVALIFLFATTILSLAGLSIYYPQYVVIDKKRLQVAAIFLLFMLYFTTSMVHDTRWGHIVFWSSVLMTCFLDIRFIIIAYKYIKTIFTIVALFSLLIWLCNLFRISLPYYHYTPDFRYNSNDNYRIYGFAVSLYTGNTPVGGLMERVCGIFAEPGHFGIYIGYILAMSRFNFKSWQNLILLMAGVLTFSTAFYGILSLGILYRIVNDKCIQYDIKRIITVSSFLLIVFFIVGFSSFFETAIDRVVGGRHISSVSDLVEARVTENSHEIFDEFLKKSDTLIGKGYYYKSSIQITNWRGFLFSFGYIGLFIALMALLVTSFYSKNKLYSLLLLAIGILVFSHRSYLFYGPTFYFATLTGSQLFIFAQDNIVHKFRNSSTK